jgi:hypothetical protein
MVDAEETLHRPFCISISPFGHKVLPSGVS